MSKFFFAAVFWLSFGSVVSSAEPDEKLHRRCLYPTVKIVHEDYRSGGTGFIVRSDKVGSEWQNVVVSCSHNFAPEENYNVVVGEYEDWSVLKATNSYRCKLAANHPRYDLAIVVFASDMQMPTAELGFDEKLYIGTKTFKFGFGLLDAVRLDRGEITSVFAAGDAKNVHRTNIFTVPGDSGGPLFCDYKVVGVVNAIRSPGGKLLHHMSYAIPIQRLKKWDEEQKSTLSWVHTTKPLPVLPFMQLALEQEILVAEEKPKP
jgi:S1-C subfamily serine protease